MDRYKNDIALAFFAGAAAILLLVSMPATYAVVAPFHSAGDYFGIGLALGTLLAFEIGAVGCKLVTLAIPQWSGRMNLLTILLLGLTTLANYWHGVDLFQQAQLAPSLAAVRDAGYGGLAASIYAAVIPLLLFVFLSATVARVKQLQTSAPLEAVTHDDSQLLLELAQAMQDRDASAQAAETYRELRNAADARAAQAEAEARDLARQLGEARHELAQADTVLIDDTPLSIRELARRLEMAESTVRRKVKKEAA
jgi:hypothetical protein